MMEVILDMPHSNKVLNFILYLTAQHSIEHELRYELLVDCFYTLLAHMYIPIQGQTTDQQQSAGGHAALQRQQSQRSQDSVDQVDNAHRQGYPGRNLPNSLDLTASMNSNATATSGTTESTETGSQGGEGAIPKTNRNSFDYYAAATSQSPQVLMPS